MHLPRLRWLIGGFCAAVVVCGSFLTASAQKPDEVAKVEKALPESAAVKPAKERRVLVYTRASGFVHGSIPLGAKTFELMGEKTGAFKVTKVTDDPAVFDDLSQFDAIVLLSTTGDFLQIKAKKEDDEAGQKRAAESKAKEADRKAALLEYVAKGGGLVGIHAATDAYYGWPEYGQMIGGYFQSHPYSKIQIRNEDPKSPINAQFEGEGFEFNDEIYVFRPGVFSRDRLRVLLSIDVEASKIDKQAREDKDYAIAWIRQHGEGRIFYTVLGHRNETWWNELPLKYFLAGTQYALGDLKADASPSGSRSAE